MFKETLESLTSSFSERIVNPFTGSFLLSWPVWNYKLILIFFSDSKVQVKISLISSLVYPNWYFVLFFGFLAPTLTALVYIYIYPYPTKWFIKHSLEKKREINTLRQEIDEETLLTKEESVVLKRKYNMGAKALEEENEEKDIIIREMRQQAAKVSEDAAEFQRAHRKLQSEFEVADALHADVLRELGATQEERDKALRLKQESNIEASAANGKIFAMTSELEKLRLSLGDAQDSLRVLHSDNSALKHKLDVVTGQEKFAADKLESMSKFSNDLARVLTAFVSFSESIASMKDLPEDLRRSAEELSTAAHVAML